MDRFAGAVFITSALLLLGGCASAPSNIHSPQAQLVNFPEVHTEANAEVGQTIVSKALRRVYPAISLPRGVVEGRPGMAGQIRVHAGLLYLYLDASIGKYYRDPRAEWGSDSGGWRPWVGGIFVPIDTSKPAVNFASTPAGIELGKVPSEGFTPTTYEALEHDGFKRELLYSGVSQNTITIVYREFKNDIARPAFSQELKYDLSQGSEIGFRGARFQVWQATNTGIRYKVIKALD